MTDRSSLPAPGWAARSWPRCSAAPGTAVEVIERRADPRTGPASEAGRSINLAISARGLHALARLGLAERMLRSPLRCAAG